MRDLSRICVVVFFVLFLLCGVSITAACQTAADTTTAAAVQEMEATSVDQILVSAANAAALENLAVAPGSTVVVDFSNSGIAQVSGSLNNAGNIYAVSTNPAINTATFMAHDIINNAGASISTVLPANGFPALSLSLANLVPNLNLSLVATRNIVNAGTIASAGSLNLSAGNSIQNVGVGAIAMMQAANNVTLNTAQLINSGVISSINSNIELVSNLARNISVDNSAGRLSALNGSINIHNLLTADKHALSVLGGDFISKQLNIFNGNGRVDLAVNQLTGMLNISAGEAHVLTSTENLNLGTISLSGDPTFFNTSGNVLINSDLIFPGQDLAIVASEDVFADNGSTVIDTSSAAGNGGDILVVAGADFTAVPGPTLTINGPSNRGGRIDFVRGARIITEVDSSGGGALGNGGDITFVAFRGTGPGASGSSGQMQIRTQAGDGALLNASGSVAGDDGNVTIIGGHNLEIGSITARGGSGQVGNISISSIQPVVDGGLPVIVDNSKITSGGFVPDPGLSGGRDLVIVANSNIFASGDVNMTAQRNVRLRTQGGGNAVAVEAGVLQPGADVLKPLCPCDIKSYGNVNITSVGNNVDIESRSSLQSNGGDIRIRSSNNTDIDEGTIEAFGGYITVNAGNNLTIDDNSLRSTARYLTDTTTDFTGGGIALYIEQPLLDLKAVLQATQAMQPGIGPGQVGNDVNVVAPSSFNGDTTAPYTPLDVNGSYIRVAKTSSPGSDNISIIRSSLLADGGAVLLNAPGTAPNRTLIFRDSNLNALAPIVNASPCTVAPSIVSATSTVAELQPTGAVVVGTADFSRNLSALNYWIWTVTDLPVSYLQQVSGTKRGAALQKGIALSNDQSFISGDRTGRSVVTELALIEVPAGGSAVVNKDNANALSVLAVAKDKSVKVTTNVGDTYVIESGEQLIVERENTSSSDVPKIARVMKSAVMMPEVVPKSIVFNGTAHSFANYLSVPSTETRTKSTADIAKSKDADCVKRVSCKVEAISRDEAGAKEMAGLPVRMSKDAQVLYIGPNHYRLNKGSILLFERQPFIVETPQGRVSVAAKAAVSIQVRRKVTRIRNLFESASNSVVAVMKKQSVKIRQGQEVSLVQHGSADPKSLVWLDNLARRNMQVCSIGKSDSIVTSEFSHVNAFTHQPIVRELFKSASPEDNALTDTLLKTAAAISTVVDRTRGPYTVPIKPQSVQLASGRG